MDLRWTPWGALLLALALAAPAQAQDAARLYGRVWTVAGDVYQGALRWDRNEASWVDLLDGTRSLDEDLLAWVRRKRGEDLDRRRSVEFRGVRVTWNDEDDDLSRTSEAGVRFGHLKELNVVGDGAELTLKSGETVEWGARSTDLGRGLRSLVVADPSRGEVVLEWPDLDRIEFLAPPRAEAPREAQRLWGTVQDRWGNGYRGFISWNLDASLTTDVLAGEESGRARAIPFTLIEKIERATSFSARVVLQGGEEVLLEGSGEVGRGSRGVQVSVPSWGQVDLGWDEFGEVRFESPPAPRAYDTFDGGHRLRGTVVREDGERITGTIIWDADEAWSWEMLDGSWRDIDFDIEMGAVVSIEKRSSSSAEVTLVNGRSFELEGTNDVGDGMRGIVVETDGQESVLVEWDRFREITFENRLRTEKR